MVRNQIGIKPRIVSKKRILQGLERESSFLFVHGLDSNSSFKAHNRACKLRNISSNIIHHPKGRSELRDAIPCEIGF